MSTPYRVNRTALRDVRRAPRFEPGTVQDHTRYVGATNPDRASVVKGLRQTLSVTVRTELLQPTPVAVQEYTAALNVHWSPDDGPDVNRAALSELAKVDIDAYLPELDRFLPDTLAIPVGQGSFVSVDLLAPSCWTELAGRGRDLGLVGEGLLGEAFDLSELRSTLDMTHGRAVIVNYVEIAPAWRGAKYGLLAAELVIRELGRCADAAALYPMQPGLEDLGERATAAAALADYWGQIGFVDFNGIMIRDLTGSGDPPKVEREPDGSEPGQA